MSIAKERRHNMQECDIRDLYKVYGHVRKYEDFPELLMTVREFIRNPNHSVYMKEGICVFLEDIAPDTVRLHIYVDPENRGRDCVNFLNKLKEDSTKTRCIFEPPKDAKHIHRLLRYMGAKETAPFVYELEIQNVERQHESVDHRQKEDR